jgi:hypothetical protein
MHTEEFAFRIIEIFLPGWEDLKAFENVSVSSCRYIDFSYR